MTEFLRYFIPGIADGSIYAICALGLVLTYKTSGVFNFAHGALAAASAYAFYEFRIKDGMPWPLAALCALLLIGVVGGLILERIANWLSAAPTVSVVVATVGLLVAIQSACTSLYGDSTIQFAEFLPTNGFKLSGVEISVGDMIIFALAIVASGGLFWFFNNARLGKAMTGVVDDPNLLSLQATNPSVVRRLAWVLGSCFTSISGMLLAPRIGISVDGLILLVIAAYGAAAVGLFENLALTVVGGFVIGVLVDYLPDFTQNFSSPILQSLPGNTPFIVLFLVLVFVPARKLTQRGVRNARRFKPVRSFSPVTTAAAMGAGLLFLILIPHLTFAPDYISRAKLPNYDSALGYVIIFASLGLITWTSGQISLCHMGFAAIGATTTAHMLGHGTPYLLALLIGGLVTVPAGLVVAVPAIRLSGIYVAIATFGFGILIQQIFYPSFLMFGVLNNIPLHRPTILGVDFGSDTAYFYLALMIMVVCLALVVLVLRSRLGGLLRALSDSPVALDSLGANTTQTRIFIFGIAAFLAGIGGAVVAGAPQNASGAAGGPFDSTNSLALVAILGFCGRRSIAAPVVAAFLYQVLPIFPYFKTDDFIQNKGIYFGVAALLVAIGPGLELPFFGGKRASERDGGSPVAQRLEEEPVGPIQPERRPRATAPAGATRSSAVDLTAPRGNVAIADKPPGRSTRVAARVGK